MIIIIHVEWNLACMIYFIPTDYIIIVKIYGKNISTLLIYYNIYENIHILQGSICWDMASNFIPI